MQVYVFILIIFPYITFFVFMGNCVCKGFAEHGEEDDELVKVVTSSGGIMELYPPITADAITTEFPGHAIFRSRDLFAQPLVHTEHLLPHHLYYLLPLNPYNKDVIKTANPKHHHNQNDVVQLQDGAVCSTPYRMSSCEHHNKRPEPEVFPRYNGSGVWKVKLVISPQQLSEILSHEARTQDLIESVRTVAKCGAGTASSVAGSDHWSVSSSWKD